MKGGRTLHLAIPGLFVARSSAPDEDPSPLAGLVARAHLERGTAASFEELLAGLFGFAPSPGCDAPFGAITREAEEGDAGDGFWACAEPVHQRPDLADAHLEPVTMEADEVSSLTLLFNDHFHDRRLQLFPSSRGGRFSLRFPADPQITTTSFSRAIATPLRSLQPRGPGAVRWLSLLTEIQMLLHGASFNQIRAERGLPEVNGLWVWGVGRLPAAPGPGVALTAVGASPLAADMAMVAKVPTVSGIAELLAGGGGWPRLLVDGRFTGGDARQGVALDSALFAVVDRALRRSHIDRLYIHHGADESLFVPAGRWPVVRARLGLASPPAVMQVDG